MQKNFLKRGVIMVFDMIKKFIDGLSDLIKRSIATIKTFVDSWKKPLDIVTTTTEATDTAEGD